MRVKKIEVRPKGTGKIIVSYGLAERGQTPIIGTVFVKDGNVQRALLDPANRVTLGLRPDTV